MEKLQVVYRKTDDLIQYARNARGRASTRSRTARGRRR